MAAVVHVNRRLTDLSVHFPWEFESVGEKFFPVRPTEFLSDQFAVWNKANLLKLDELTPLGDDESPPDVELKQDADVSFSCKVFGIQSPGKWITEKNADPSLDYETERTIQLTTALRLRLEYLRVNQRLRSTTYMTANSTLTAAQRFDNYGSASSKPISTLRAVVNTIGYANQGKKPNMLAGTTFAWQAVANSEEFKDLVKYNVVQTVREEAARSANGYISLIESLIGVAPGSILVSDAVYNVAASNQTAIYTTFMGPDIVLGYVEAQTGLRKYSLSAGFQWSAYSNDPQAIIAVPRYHNTVVPTEDLRAFCVIDPKIIVPELGYLLKGVIDSTDTTTYGNLVAY
jgi:hypothetical protein